MRVINERPDKEIRLSHGDHVHVYLRDEEIEFDFFCDGTGNKFTITKDEIRKWLNI